MLSCIPTGGGFLWPTLQVAILDAEGAGQLPLPDSHADVSPSNGTGLRALSSPLQGSSPQRSLSPVFATSTLAAVQSALQKRQLQLQVREGRSAKKGPF